jgi:rhodanese-related sulfurtransferase
MKNFQDLVQEALKNIPEVDIYQLKEKIESNKQIKLIDIREDREWVSGRIPSAYHIGRGVLEKASRKLLIVKMKLFCTAQVVLGQF